MITIVDYGIGNLLSIKNMIRKIGYDSQICSDPDEIYKSSKLILPGVGAFDTGMKNLADRKLLEVLNTKIIVEKIPVLGICLGMQLLTRSSEEGILPGLGYLPGKTTRFKVSDLQLKVPHMGWNVVKIEKESPLFKDMFDENRFYFVHSFHVECDNKSDILNLTEYGYNFVSAFEKDNILGAQYHPEKSHKFGMKLLENYIKHY